jgi:hypothetical protein
VGVYVAPVAGEGEAVVAGVGLVCLLALCFLCQYTGVDVNRTHGWRLSCSLGP